MISFNKNMDMFATIYFVNMVAIVFNDSEPGRDLILLYLMICCVYLIVIKLWDMCSSNNESTCIRLGKFLMNLLFICLTISMLMNIYRLEVNGTLLFFILCLIINIWTVQLVLKRTRVDEQEDGETSYIKFLKIYCRIYVGIYEFLKNVLILVIILWVLRKISERSKQGRFNYTAYFCSGICSDQIYNCTQKEDKNILVFDLFMISTNLVPGIQILAHRIQNHITRQDRKVFLNGKKIVFNVISIVVFTFLVVYLDRHGAEFMDNTISKCTQDEFVNGKYMVEFDDISPIARTRYRGEDVQFVVPIQRKKTDMSCLFFIKDDPGQHRAYPVVSEHVNLYGLMEPDSGIYELRRTNDSVLSTAIKSNNRDCPQISYNLTVMKPEVRYIVPRFRGVFLHIIYIYKCLKESDVFNVHYTVNGVDINDVCTNDFLSCSLDSWLIKNTLILNRIEINRVQLQWNVIEASFCVCIEMFGRHEITIQREIYNATSKSYEIVNFAYPVQVVIVPNSTYTEGTVRDPTDPRSNDFIYKLIEESETITVRLPVFGEIRINIYNFLSTIMFAFSLAFMYKLYPILRHVLTHCCYYLNLMRYVPRRRWLSSPLQPFTPNFAHLNCDDEILYDVFLSYSETEQEYEFARDVILQYLEHSCHFKVCFPDRDFSNTPGRTRLSLYYNATQKSKHFVVILSRAYLEDTDCNDIQLTRCILPLLNSSVRQGRKLVIVRVDTEARLPNQVRHWPDVEVIEWTAEDDDMRHKAKLKTVLMNI